MYNNIIFEETNHTLMKKSLLSLLLFPVLLNAQNLVPNPGFETQTSCPLVSEITKAPPWNSPSIGTPDLFNSTCPQQNVLARTGIGSSGIFVISSFPNSREYLQARLTSPLQTGQTYCVEFYVKRSNYKYASDRFGVYFSIDSVRLNQTNPLPFTPQVQHQLGNFIRSTSTWTKISGSFTASGGESFIIIGNFFDDANTAKDSVGSGSSVGYYSIDDVSVTACVTGINGLANAKTKIYPNPSNSILFVEFVEPAESLRIFSMNGQLILEQKNPALLQEVNTAFFSDGLYLLEVSTSSGSALKKFSVAH